MIRFIPFVLSDSNDDSGGDIDDDDGVDTVTGNKAEEAMGDDVDRILDVVVIGDDDIIDPGDERCRVVVGDAVGTARGFVVVEWIIPTCRDAGDEDIAAITSRGTWDS